MLLIDIFYLDMLLMDMVYYMLMDMLLIDIFYLDMLLMDMMFFYMN
jgi:hypothetical protein